MTEHALFQRAAVALGATILAPLFVAITGLGDSGSVSPIASYVGRTSATQTVNETINDDSKSSDKTSTESSDKSSNGSSAAVESAGAKAAGSYTVKDGDTYGCIAEKYYGSYEMWPQVYAQNAGYPGFEEYHLDVGAKLQMPAVSAAESLPKTALCK